MFVEDTLLELVFELVHYVTVCKIEVDPCMEAAWMIGTILAEKFDLKISKIVEGKFVFWFLEIESFQIEW